MKTKMSFAQKVWAYMKGNPIVVMMVGISIIVGSTIPNFFSLENFNVLMGNTTIRFIIALGVSGCLITKGTDLSAGRQAALAATLTGVMIQRADYTSRLFPWMPEMNMWVALLIVLIIGAFIGAITGLIVSRLNVPPFIATLGVQTIVYGINLIYTNAQPIGGQSQQFKDFFNWKILAIGNFKGFSGFILFAVVFGLLFWFLYNKTTHGKYMYAIGGNESAAEVSGVNVPVRKTLIYMTAGIMYAFAGFLMTGKSGGASASMGVSYELEAIAGCTIGGVSTTGGIGTVGGILVGVLVFELLKIILQFVGADPNFNYIVQGLVVITAVAMDIRKYVKKK